MVRRISLIILLILVYIRLGEANYIRNREIVQDTILLTKVIQGECNYCSIYEKMLIGSVVINRSKSTSIKEEIYKKNQFLGIRNNFEFDKNTYLLAYKLIVNGSINDSIKYFLIMEKSKDKKFKRKIKKMKKLKTKYKTKHEFFYN